jgi:soluble lytic murein transglycosylase-like protein
VSYVRKLIGIVCATALVSAPAALAATGAEDDGKKRTKIVAHTLLDKQWKRAKRELREAKRDGGGGAVGIPPQLEAIAACESGSNPRAVSASGTYRGKYQFSTATWAAVGGKGDPAAAPEAEQDKRAAMLYARSGPGQWPVCGS